MKAKMAILMYVVAAFVLVTAAGCQREGSAQKAGKQVDGAVAKAGDKIDDAVDKLKK
jgi:hypothetical protein